MLYREVRSVGRLQSKQILIAFFFWRVRALYHRHIIVRGHPSIHASNVRQKTNCRHQSQHVMTFSTYFRSEPSCFVAWLDWFGFG